MTGPIVITGMHRSGTSLLADVVRRWGAVAGDDLIPSSRWNPHGYWEHAPLVRFNDELLGNLDSSWELPPEDGGGLEHLAKDDHWRGRAYFLMSEMNGVDVWFWK